MTDFIISTLLLFFLLAAHHTRCQNSPSDLDIGGKHTLASKQDCLLPSLLASQGGERENKTEIPVCAPSVLPVILLVQGKEYSSRDFRTSGKSRAVGPPGLLQLDMSCAGAALARLREGQLPGHQHYTPLAWVL